MYLQDHREPVHIKKVMKEIAYLLIHIRDDDGAIQRIIPLIYDDIYIKTLDIIQNDCEILLNHYSNSLLLNDNQNTNNSLLSVKPKGNNHNDYGINHHRIVLSNDIYKKKKNRFLVRNWRRIINNNKSFNDTKKQSIISSSCPLEILPTVSTIVYISLFHELHEIKSPHSKIANLNNNSNTIRNKKSKQQLRTKRCDNNNNQALLPELMNITRQFHYLYGNQFIQNVLFQQYQNEKVYYDGKKIHVIHPIIIQNLNMLVTCHELQKKYYSYKSIPNDLLIIIQQYAKEICYIYGNSNDNGIMNINDTSNGIINTSLLDDTTMNVLSMIEKIDQERNIIKAKINTIKTSQECNDSPSLLLCSSTNISVDDVTTEQERQNSGDSNDIVENTSMINENSVVIIPQTVSCWLHDNHNNTFLEETTIRSDNTRTALTSRSSFHVSVDDETSIKEEQHITSTDSNDIIIAIANNMINEHKVIIPNNNVRSSDENQLDVKQITLLNDITAPLEENSTTEESTNVSNGLCESKNDIHVDDCKNNDAFLLIIKDINDQYDSERIGDPDVKMTTDDGNNKNQMRTNDNDSFVVIDDPWSFRPIKTFISNNDDNDVDIINDYYFTMDVSAAHHNNVIANKNNVDRQQENKRASNNNSYRRILPKKKKQRSFAERKTF